VQGRFPTLILNKNVAILVTLDGEVPASRSPVLCLTEKLSELLSELDLVHCMSQASPSVMIAQAASVKASAEA
jgi:hypothetical protein